LAGEPERTRDARALAESALVRISAHTGSIDIPLVVLGGLVPELLCTTTEVRHQGTTDVDIQINLEVEVDGEHASQLEQALLAAGFSADPERSWRWLDHERGTMAKVEFLCDLDDEPAESLVTFRGAKTLGAVNLRGTGYAARDWNFHNLSATIDDRLVSARVRFAALAGYLVAKGHALRNRRLEKDMYDLAYVLIHNDAGGPGPAAGEVIAKFGTDLPSLQSMFREVGASFSSPADAGPTAYVRLALDNEPDEDSALLAADAYAAIAEFLGRLYP
jgi:hypothetical protein